MPMKTGKPRVLLGKYWLDPHDRGIRYVAGVLRDAGTEVVYVNYQHIEDLIQAAVQEDVDCVALSYLSGGEDYDVPRVLQLLKQNNLDHVPVILGGIKHPEKPPKFIKMGVENYFGPGSDLNELVEFVKSLSVQKGA